MPRKANQQDKTEKKEEKKAFGRTVRSDGNVALTVLCDPKQDKDILEFFEVNTAVTYIAKEAIRQWMRDQEKRHTPSNPNLDIEKLVELLQNKEQAASIGFATNDTETDVTEEVEVKEELTDEAKENMKTFDF
ncbi:hypothetical protein [Bacillus cereus]|uniref:hypothetical protein n=1 Tax=Bacillus cereus TaxID=1396 RepID=UPI000C285E94|nr:hypothetical protein [Bacillus cereus]